MKKQFLHGMHSLMSAGFLVYLFMNDLLGCLFAFVVIEWHLLIGVNVWWVYLALQNIPSTFVLTLGNKVVSMVL